jgi:hypothetical protein
VCWACVVCGVWSELRGWSRLHCRSLSGGLNKQSAEDVAWYVYYLEPEKETPRGVLYSVGIGEDGEVK